MEPIQVILETGKKKCFASAADWPGWGRSGRDEESALRTLLDYGSRYRQVVQSTGLKFLIPSTYSEFVIFERLEGDYTTDFGVPGIIASSESEPVNALDLQRFNTVLKACWEAFDRAVGQAKGKELRKGPRGGGRDAKKILEYVVGAEQSYLRRLVWKSGKAKEMSLEEEIKYTRAETLTALERAVKEGLPTQGPRGGKIWPPRYFVRRVAWHVLDHAWEIEDRII